MVVAGDDDIIKMNQNGSATTTMHMVKRVIYLRLVISDIKRDIPKN